MTRGQKILVVLGFLVLVLVVVNVIKWLQPAITSAVGGVFAQAAQPQPTKTPTPDETIVSLGQTVAALKMTSTALAITQTRLSTALTTTNTPAPTQTNAPSATPTVTTTATMLSATATPAPTLTPTPDKVDKLSTAVAQLAARIEPSATLTVSASSLVTTTGQVTGTGQITGVVAMASGEFRPGWSTDWYRSPFTRTTDSLPITGTIETFAEPGVLLDNTAAYDHMSAADTPVLVPEGGYAYIAIGGVTLSHNGGQITLYPQERNIYLIVARGLPDDGGSSDLNQIVLASQYVRGAGIYSPMPAGAYVSLGWTIQQITASFRDPNCGGTGCSQATIVVIDLKTHTFRQWVVKDPKLPRQWVAVG